MAQMKRTHTLQCRAQPGHQHDLALCLAPEQPRVTAVPWAPDEVTAAKRASTDINSAECVLMMVI